MITALARLCLAPVPSGAATMQADDCKAVSVDVFTEMYLSMSPIFLLTFNMVLDTYN